MTKEELAKKLIGTNVANSAYGDGQIVGVKVSFDGVMVSVKFQNAIKDYSAFIAVESGYLTFLDQDGSEIYSQLKYLFTPREEKTVRAELQNIISDNVDLNELVKKLMDGQSITADLIRLYRNVDFENYLFSYGTKLLTWKISGIKLISEKLHIILVLFSYIALRDYDGDFHGKIFAIVSQYVSDTKFDQTTVANEVRDIIEDMGLREKIPYLKLFDIK